MTSVDPAVGQAGGKVLEGVVRICSAAVATLGLLAPSAVVVRRLRRRRDRAHRPGGP